MSGSPIAPPSVDESTLPPADKTADGIGIIDVAAGTVDTVLQAGSDPEQLAVSLDGTRVYVANEDVGAASVVDVASSEILASLPVVGGRPKASRSVPMARLDEPGDDRAIDEVVNR